MRPEPLRVASAAERLAYAKWFFRLVAPAGELTGDGSYTERVSVNFLLDLTNLASASLRAMDRTLRGCP
ncbi:hypothetical protein DPMN_077551 [Dreissena polymorpha]|uniref:Uncharacterized protein n=1 Tax=Dreissena polymorpha TaxID=45954 RepID=A0A9D4BRG0_DREPO|nr:hypothetical protein DPMN_077551 [Dreissena polymorpha]